MKKYVNRREFLKVSGLSVLGAVLSGCKWVGLIEQHQFADLPPIPPDAPNVIFIVLDTVRAQSLSLYNYHRETTPQLKRLASQGVLFRNAISASPWTLPSHASMFTGQYPHKLNADWQTPLNSDFPTLAEAFRSKGYLTAGFVANYHYCSYEYGLNRGFIHYEDYRISPGQAVLSSSLSRKIVDELRIQESFANHENFGRKSAEQISRDFLTWISTLRENRPFFAFLNFLDAHDPYLPPKEFADKYLDNSYNGFVTPEIAETLPPLRVNELRDAYDAAIAYLDHQIGVLFDRLKALDLLKNTLVIITSDHGEQFGEHNLMTHGNSLYLPLLHVPLIVIFPRRIPAGQIISSPVSLRDLPTTIINLTDLASEIAFPGESLSRYWIGKPNEDMLLSEVNISWDINEIPMVKGRMKSIMLNRMHYIRNPDGREELYDSFEDPIEEHNLVNKPGSQAALKQIRTGLKHLAGL